MTEPEGPGGAAKPPRSRWRVTGERIDNSERVTYYVDARSREAAERAVAKQGVLVKGVEIATPGSGNPASPEELGLADVQASSVHLESVRPGAAFEFGFYAFLGGLVAYLVVGLIVWVILLMLGIIKF